MPRISLATVISYANASSTTGGVGPDHQLIVVVGVRLVELARDFDRVELRLLGEPLADGAAAAAGRAVARSGRPA